MVEECTCTTTCNIAIIFICSLIYTSFMIDKCSISNAFIDTLSDSQKELYENIKRERSMIYFGGILVGLFISYLYMKIVPSQNSKINTVCTVLSITFLVAYFFYIFYPKKYSIILELETRQQREEWHAIYKKMQYHYHIGLALGFIFVLFFSGC